MILVFPFAGIFFGLIGAVTAARKGRSSLAWFLICFFTIFFGLIVLLVIDSSTESSLNEVYRDDQKWRTLKEVDPEIAAAAKEANLIGPTAEKKLADKYFLLNDKSYLAAILEQIRNTHGEVSKGTILGIRYRTDSSGMYIATSGKLVGRAYYTLEELELAINQHHKRG